jgi:glycosyltransferase involved in cell wall biosynthesis
MSAVSDPPPSAVGWIDRRHLVRVALNVEQLLSPSPGGIGRYTRQLATLLASEEPADEVIPFVAHHRRAQVSEVLGVAGIDAEAVILRLPRPLLYESWVRLGLPPLTRSLRRVDVVHAPSVAVPGRGSIPLVVTVHDAAAELYPEAFTAHGRRFHAEGVKAAARRADLVIAVSQAAADEIVAHTPVRAESVRVVYHGVDAPVIAAEERRSRLQARGLADRDYLLWVGSLEPRKDVATLLSALVKLRTGGMTTPAVVLAGFRGWLNADIVSEEARRVIGDDLIQAGPVDERDLWSLYGGAMLLALPSRHEGFGLTAVEAMTQGTPVVCSDLPVTREILGPAAVRLPAGDIGAWAEAIEALVSDPNRRRRLGGEGRRWAARYSTSRFVAATRAVYREVGA